ncbi:MAG: hypothetical protein Q9160_002906 [Pyrenula sp. 1 TL-2023]
MTDPLPLQRYPKPQTLSQADEVDFLHDAAVNSIIEYPSHANVVNDEATLSEYFNWETQGKVSSPESDLISGLLEESAIRLQSTCAVRQHKVSTLHKASEVPCSLSIIIYGPIDLSEDIGHYLGDVGVFLQDPLGCIRNVKYSNPQRLSTSNEEIYQMTFDFDNPKGPAHLEDFHTRKGAVEAFHSDDHLPETEQPGILKTTMRSHQRKALTFMLRRENGWSFQEPPDIWEEVWSVNGRRFRNTVTDVLESECPSPFHGGILADPPGLGKSLTMLSLVSSDLSSSEKNTGDSPDAEQDSTHVHTTLIVVPPALMSNWIQEIQKHFPPHSINVLQHHGQRRLSGASEASSYHIVLTTYHTLAADWKKDIGSTRLNNLAHWIRNGASQLAIAACSLQASSRWAVTGTPLQNRLTDVSTLLRFIRAYPYDQPSVFKTDIADMLKSGNKQIATKRLGILLDYVMLARPKTTIELPPRRDTICPLNLSRSEQLVYDKYRNNALQTVDVALESSSISSNVYFNVLQQINALRMICDLGIYHPTPGLKPRTESSHDHQRWDHEIAQDHFNNLSALGDIACRQCQASIEVLSDQMTPTAQNREVRAHFLRCNQLICSSCFKNVPSIMQKKGLCGHWPPCAIASISLNADAETGDLDVPALPALTQALPTKIAELLRQLNSHPPETKSLIYSYWTSTLDIIAQGLDRSGICHVRFDGRVSLKGRQDAINKLQKDPATQVMLLTVSCGGVGLNLTAASRAYLMEPHWNPTVEEQAFARIHRLGQEKEVTTVRFMVKDTIEEHVIKIQESKTAIADLVLATGDKSKTADNIARLKNPFLRSGRNGSPTTVNPFPTPGDILPMLYDQEEGSKFQKVNQ